MSFIVLVRCKDEISWLPDLKHGIESQTVQPAKVVFVDSGSTDGSVEFAQNSGWQVISYSETPFNYSRAINLGMEHCNEEFALILSAHCLLFDVFAVERLIDAMAIKDVVGTFGRQLPTNKSRAVDVRDLLTVFGRERQIFAEYPFFHNAFALIRTCTWSDLKFDESLNGMEDREWANSVCAAGKKIVYEPKACVFHEHGLNQSNDSSRAVRTVEMLKHVHRDDLFVSDRHKLSHGKISYSRISVN